MCLNSSMENEDQKDVQKLLQQLPKLSELFTIQQRVGEGTFSTVYLARLRNNTERKQFALKHIVPTCHPERIRFELDCLKNLGGQNNVAGVDLCLREKNCIVFVMPYQPHDAFNDYVRDMDATEVALYMKNLLIAVAHVHKHRIIHRDIKPSNFLYDRKNKKYLLVDFGLAQKMKDVPVLNKRKRESESDSKDDVHPTLKKPLLENSCSKKDENKMDGRKKCAKENNPESIKVNEAFERKEEFLKQMVATTKVPAKVEHHCCRCYGKPTTCSICVVRKTLYASRAGTPGFRPPEVLLKSIVQTTAIDMWAVGVILIWILSRCINFFPSPDDMTALAEIIVLFGTDAVRKVAINCGRHLICSEQSKGMDLQQLCDQLRSRGKKQDVKGEFPQTVFDLLKKLLDVNPNTRISAENALKHEFFVGVDN